MLRRRHDRIISAARRTATEEYRTIGCAQRSADAQVFQQIWVGDIEPPERNKIGKVTLARFQRQLAIITVVRDMEAIE